MTKDEVLSFLKESGKPVSGQEMSRMLGISRAAVWKAIEQLRRDGYEISAGTNRGYQLAHSPDRLTREGVLAALGEHPWKNYVQVFDSIDSTNTYARQLAAGGAPEGTVVVADHQTAGRGRRGRSFLSPSGVGVYLTVLLRPQVRPEQILHLTAMVGVAACNAVERVSGLRPGIKWTNDLVYGKKKMSGILTELSVEAETRETSYVVSGIGLNCGEDEFPEELRDMATSIKMETGKPVDRCELAAELIRELERMNRGLFTEKEIWLRQFARDCVTVGQDVKIVRGDEVRFAHVDGIGPDAELLVTYPDGAKDTVSSGEVSVRGMYGYL